MGKGLAAAFGMLLEPASAVETARTEKLAWVIPALLLAIATAAVAWLVVPLSQEVMLKNPPEGMSREQISQMQDRMGAMSKVGMFVAPVVAGISIVVMAALALMTCNILGMQAKFGELLNLVSMAGMVKVIHSAAMFAVLKLKGDSIETVADLSPPFGLDLFLPDGVNKYARAFLNYFSVFEIWYLIILALAIAAMYRVGKGKGFASITLVWMLPLLMTLVGAIFR